ncbi:hypothetical protein BDV95DRAFT_606191 [Massariosphaeria phaeospora]|uniref:Uncharacterized protein n=1 Tax=Massariosphaeria phaeospora TaxID=100035 RepID=A0A7C8MA19_9PLEO|nr:hypothetical protein BDV95DRAFT_606191 [Massariosphaeria phaeospora]
MPELLSPRSARKRKQTDNAIEKHPKQTRKKHGKKTADNGADCEVQTTERRLRRLRKHAPQSYLEIKERALTQRLTVLSRERCGTEQVPEEKVVMAGSTGNVYTQHIGLTPSCDCPHAKKRNQCKHILYVMLRVLKAPEPIAYQLALLSSELRSVFQHAAPIPDAKPTADASSAADADAADSNRKAIEGECPICYTDFEPGSEAIVYCKAGCGNNVHRDCMNSWIAAKHGNATCPYCRTKWEADPKALGKVDLQGARKNEDGYHNVAGQIGLSGERDYSSYHQHWVRRQFGY